MSSHYPMAPLTFLSDGAISRGMVVKAGSDRRHIAKSVSATSKNIGVAQSSTDAAEQAIEVALPGGGGVGLAGGVIAIGDFLTADAAGKLIATTSANDKVVAQAMEDAVLDDIFSIHNVNFNY